VKIGLTASCFDLFHAGHVSMLEEAKKECEYLIAAIQMDPSIDRPEKNQPIQTLIERQIQVRACKFVDETIVYSTEEELIILLKTLPIDVRILGIEYQSRDFTGRGIVPEYFNNRKHSFSTTELKERIQKNG